MCDALCALGPATAGRATLFAKNSDRPPGEAQRLEWHPPRRDPGRLRTTYIEIDPHAGPTLGVLGSRPDWMWGFEHGVNEALVAIGNEGIYTTLDPRTFPDALTGMDLVRLGLERAATASAAVEVVTDLLERYGQGGPCHPGRERPYWSSLLIVDPRQAFVVETSGSTWAVEHVEVRRAVSNRTTIESFDAEHRIDQTVVARVVDPRLAASRELLAAGPVDVDGVRRHLRSHAGGPDGWTICMHVDGEEVTAASLIATLDPAAPVARVSAGSPCTSLFVPVPLGVDVGTPPSWERFAALDPSSRPLLAALEDELETDFEPADGWPAEAWRRVDACLGELETMVGSR